MQPPVSLAAPANLSGLGADVMETGAMETGATQRGSEGGGRVMLTTFIPQQPDRACAVSAAPAGGGVRGWGRDGLGTGAGKGARGRGGR